MNIRVLDKNDKAALEQLIFTIENALPVAEWWIPIDDIERSHFFDADWTCFLGAFNDDNELVAASARNRGIDTILAVAHPDNVASNSSFRRLGAELKATATVFGSYLRNMYILPW